MKTVVNNLGAEIAVTSRVKSDLDLKLTLTLTNESATPFRLNATDMDVPTLILNFSQADGKPLPTGPPPMPIVNDGQAGRMVLRPGEPMIQTFPGAALFLSRLKPGRYAVWFSYTNPADYPGEWHGSIETQKVEFEVVPPILHVVK